MDDVTLYLGDCLDILPTLGRVDAVVTDPPYGIAHPCNFQGNGGQSERLQVVDDFPMLWATMFRSLSCPHVDA